MAHSAKGRARRAAGGSQRGRGDTDTLSVTELPLLWLPSAGAFVGLRTLDIVE